MIQGSALGWEGQLTIFDFSKTACYRCLYPICPKGLGSCGESGVVGAVPGVIGVLQSLETIKVILGMEGCLKGYLLVFDGKEAKFKKVKLRNKQR